MRPLGVQVLALAYRTGEAWNESAYSNPEFDAKLEKALAIPDPKAREVVMKDLEQILQDSGIIIQPYWRNALQPPHEGGDGLRDASPLRDPSRARMAQRLRPLAQKVASLAGPLP